MALTFFPSNRVKVFPCAYRGQYQTTDNQTGLYDPESRLNTEYNFVHSSNDWKESYIISWTKETESSESYLLKCVIGGYYFEISECKESEFIDGNNIYNLYIKLTPEILREANTKDKERKTYRLAAFKKYGSVTTGLDDSDGDFRGIKLSVTKISGAIELVVFTNDKKINSSVFLPNISSGSGHSENDVKPNSIQTESNIASGERSFAIGNETIANGKSSFSSGKETKALGENSSASGELTTAYSKNSGASGYGEKIKLIATNFEPTNKIITVTSWDKNILVNKILEQDNNYYKIVATNQSSKQITIDSPNFNKDKDFYIVHGIAYGNISQTFGNINTATGNYSLATGNNTVSSGLGAHSEGNATIASGDYSHAEGNYTIASKNYAHAEGNNTTASGDYSHAEGNNTTATGTGAIAVGNKSNAVGNYSIAAGTDSTSNGECSIAVGKANIANSNGSIALGNNTKATKEYQTVLGKFNAETDGEFIIGIGENNDKRNNALVVNNTTTTIKNTVTIKNNDDSTTHNFSPTTTEINTATNTVNGTTNTIVGNTNTLKVSDVEKIAVNATNTAITNTNITATADVFKVCKSTTEKLKINDTDTTVNNTNVTINATKFAVTATDATTPIKLTGKTSIVGNTDITGTLSSTDNIHIGNNSGAAKSIIYKTFNGSQEEVLRFISSSTANYGAGVVVGGNGTTAIVSGEGGKTPTTDWNDENLYLSADARVFISTNTDSGWDSRKSWQFNAAGNLICPGYIDSVINTTAANDSVKELVKATMASNDYFRILVGGKDDAGYVEIATADNGNEPIYVRQYSGEGFFGTISNSITLLDASGNTTLPKSLTIGDANRTSVIGTNGKGLVVSTAVGGNWNIELTNIAQSGSGSNEASICYNAFDKNSTHGSWIVGQGCGAAGDNFAWYWYPNSTVRTGAENKAYLTKDGEFNAYTFNAKSDKRLKENIIEYKSEKSILDLPVYKFDFIDGPKNQIGCLAQDLQEICPEIVKENENGYLSITESKLVYLLLEEVKKLKAEVEVLKDKK